MTEHHDDDLPADAFPAVIPPRFTAPPEPQYAVRLRLRDWWAWLRHAGVVRLGADQVDLLVPVVTSGAAVLNSGEGGISATTLTAHGGPGAPGRMVGDTWTGGGGASSMDWRDHLDAMTPAHGGPPGPHSADLFQLPGAPWPGARTCCASTHGGRHNITCPEVAGHRARACCASQPTQVHTPSCPGSAGWRDLLDEQEHHTAPRAAHAHAHADVCTEACPAYGNYRDPAHLQPVALVQASPGHVHDAAAPDVCAEGCPAYLPQMVQWAGPLTPTAGGQPRDCCGTWPGTGHLASCDQAGG